MPSPPPSTSTRCGAPCAGHQDVAGYARFLDYSAGVYREGYEKLGHVAFHTPDVAGTVKFYCDVLGFVVTSFAYHEYPSLPEGELAKLRAVEHHRPHVRQPELVVADAEGAPFRAVGQQPRQFGLKVAWPAGDELEPAGRNVRRGDRDVDARLLPGQADHRLGEIGDLDGFAHVEHVELAALRLRRERPVEGRAGLLRAARRGLGVEQASDLRAFELGEADIDRARQHSGLGERGGGEFGDLAVARRQRSQGLAAGEYRVVGTDVARERVGRPRASKAVAKVGPSTSVPVESP